MADAPYVFLRCHIALDEGKAKVTALRFKLAVTQALNTLFGEVGAALPVDLLGFDEPKQEAILRLPSNSNDLQSNKASASDDQESDLRLRRWPQPIMRQKRSPMLLLVFLLVGFASGILMGVFVIAAHADQACPSGVQLQQQPSAAGESSGRSAWPPFRDATLPASARAWDLIGRLTLEEKAALLTFDSYMVDRLGGTQFDGGVQSMRGNECLHGVYNVFSNASGRYFPDRRVTSFPQAIGLAASWNTSLLWRVADVSSTEAVALRNWHRARNDTGGVYNAYLTCWAPVINIARDARWGRVAETYGEDPYLTLALAAPFVRALQGSHPRYLKVAAGVKHFTLYDGPEQGRFSFDAAPPPRDLEATWLAHWRALVQEVQRTTPHPLSGVMASYSALEGVPVAGNRRLLADALRTDMGFSGWVVCDCGAVSNMASEHRYVRNATYAAAAAIAAGVDIFCDDEALAEVPNAVGMGLLPSPLLDTALFRLVSQQIKLGVYDPHDGRNPYDAYGEELLDAPAHQQLAREAAAQAVVLLGNSHGVLPLRPSQRVAVLGPSAHETFSASEGGPWDQNTDLHPFYLHIYNGIPASISTPLSAIEARAASVAYARGCSRHGADTSGIGAAAAAARGADVAVVVVGLDASYEEEDVDRVHRDNNLWSLPGPQAKLVDAVVETGTPTVLVLINGGPLAVLEPRGGALVEAFYGGQAAGEGLAAVLYGEVNPSGRMPVTAYASEAQAGDIRSYDMTAGLGRTYRYLRAGGEPLYPFGFGLSYTSWRYGQMHISSSEMHISSSETRASLASPGAPAEGTGCMYSEDDALQLRLNLSNTGGVDGAEVAQLYAGFTAAFEPRAHISAHVPPRQLAGFRKVFLRAGASAEVRFEIVPSRLTGWRFFHEASTTLHLAAGGVSPTAKTLAGMVTTSLQVCRR